MDQSEDTSVDYTKSMSNIREFKCVWSGHSFREPMPAKNEKYVDKRKDIDAYSAQLAIDISNRSTDWKYVNITQFGGM